MGEGGGEGTVRRDEHLEGARGRVGEGEKNHRTRRLGDTETRGEERYGRVGEERYLSR